MRAGASRVATRAVLESAALVSLDGPRAVLACPPEYRAMARQRLGAIGELFEQVCGRPVVVTLQEAGAASDTADGGRAIESGMAAPPREGRPSAPAANPADHPIVKRTMELFSARIVDVRPAARAPAAPEEV
ncbi:MAG: hypothetical protein JNM07_13140 [Phycisphaerae bacterium]|nr:hypothetical protein [Phycisphaerae bacterium]